ncbi:hypothetical protein [Winogradskyella flava]|uniref:hypothetical protein n=1 Tax=Winogradskyella flava TaxID=1884876 RepID=UPI0024936F1E|nr:hypothetical protein [Winogradskyella flava]
MKKTILFIFLVSGTLGYSQLNLNKIKKAKSKVEKELINTTKDMSQNPCSSAQKSLTKYLQKLEDKKAENQVSSGSFKTYINSAERYLKSIKSKCPDLDISAEENQLNAFKSDLNNAGGADGARQASIRKGYYDKAIDDLVGDSHPAYNDFKKAKSNFLIKAFEYYRHNKPTESFTRLKEAKGEFSSIASNHKDLDFTIVHSEMKRLEGLLKSESGTEINSKLAKENVANYFRDIHMNLNYVYSETSHGADATQGLQFTESHKKLHKTQELFKDFSKTDYLQAVEDAKSNGTYTSAQFYIEKVVEALNDYSNFINKSASTFNTYLNNLNTFGIKGDPTKELEELEATKLFCQLLLKFAPDNTKAVQWLNQVETQISKKTLGITYVSNMHKTHLGKMLFSNKEVVIGNESESDFSSNFKSGDYIYATVYLPAKLRELTDSYAANDVKILVNGGIISEPESTAVWVTTPMQEKNYLQFAIIPSKSWKQKYGKPYVENKLRTHEHIANALITAGPYSETTLSAEVFFRGTNSSIKGEFSIDLSSGIDKLETIVNQEENARLADAKLPKAGMQNSGLEKEALGIMQRKSGSSKTYTKAIITSVNWDYDKNWNGVILSRSLVIALVSKEHDGKCMYQYFNFKQQAQGGGKYNSNLEFAGAGQNVYISCDNAN